MKKTFFLCIFFLFCMSCEVCGAELSAQYACVLEPVNGVYLSEKNGDDRYPMASTTKIMTALIALEQCALDETVTISPTAAGTEGSSAYLRAGEQLTMENLLYGLMLNSGNDAAMAIAEHISGSKEEFARLMNRRAAQLGLKNTAFRNPSGLDEDGHYTTAKELALIAAEAMKLPAFREIVASQTHRADNAAAGETRYFSNHNKLLHLYPDAVGIKTGYTKSTGRCLVSAAERDGVLLIGVTLCAPNDWNDHKAMLDEGFSRIQMEPVVTEGQILKTLKTDTGEYPLISGRTLSVPVIDGKKPPADMVIHAPAELTGGMNAGELAGKAEVYRGGRYLGQIELLSRDQIPASQQIKLRKTFADCIREVLSKIGLGSSVGATLCGRPSSQIAYLCVSDEINRFPQRAHTQVRPYRYS